MNVDKYYTHLVACIVIYLVYTLPINAQKLISYGPEDLTASVHYNQFLFLTYKNSYKKQFAYPVKGVYSPTHYGDGSRDIVGSGVCNYIYIPTNRSLLPGNQYRLSLTVKMGKAYKQMPYFQSHFGVAASSDLFENFFGLWNKHFVPITVDTTEVPVLVDLIFRPLCTSQYLVIGVFQGSTMDNQNCFACQYSFELYNLIIEKYDDPQAKFVYLCDAFEEERLTRKFTTGYDTDTVYFESGSAEIEKEYFSILDSITPKLRTKQDLITLYGYTDKNGRDNEELGAARNTAVRDALVLRGIDTVRILTVNYGESRASEKISQEDRRVEIDVNRGKLYQKYYTEALQAAARGDYSMASAKMSHWIKMVPPENSIYALFDCWGEGERLSFFKRNLEKIIRSRYYYKGNDLKFTIDSLYCEDQKGRTLSMYLRMNHLPDFPGECYYSMDSLRDISHQSVVDRFYGEYGFPTVNDVGERGNKVLPYMILHARDTLFQMKYIPIMQKACEEEKISWELYAMLYDKMSITRTGHQRYGTQYLMDKNGVISGLFPLEDEDMVAEYRKQVGLVPLGDF